MPSHRRIRCEMCGELVNAVCDFWDDSGPRAVRHKVCIPCLAICFDQAKATNERG